MLAAIVLNYAQFIPDFDTSSDLFQSIYYREWVNTTWFPLSNLVSYFILTLLGWSLVNLVTLGNSKAFIDGNGTYEGIKIACVCAPLLFMISAIVMLRAKNDLSGYCEEESYEAESSHKIYLTASNEGEVDQLTQAVIDTENPLLFLMFTLRQQNYLGSETVPGCMIYDQ